MTNEDLMGLIKVAISKWPGLPDPTKPYTHRFPASSPSRDAQSVGRFSGVIEVRLEAARTYSDVDWHLTGAVVFMPNAVMATAARLADITDAFDDDGLVAPRLDWVNPHLEGYAVEPEPPGPMAGWEDDPFDLGRAVL
jgi:hypothetical protein